LKRPPSSLTEPALRLIARSYLRRLGEEHRTERLRISFNTRLRTAIGRSDPPRRRIYLNPRLIDRYPRELVPTLVHELCHVVAGLAAGHGPRWKGLMRRCGLRPDTYHDLDVSGLQPRRRSWRWRCRACGRTYVRRHRTAAAQRCRRCGASLRRVTQARPARAARRPESRGR
jgi:predicted SprT family Zn-dependent metalloprotease